MPSVEINGAGLLPSEPYFSGSFDALDASSASGSPDEHSRSDFDAFWDRIKVVDPAGAYHLHEVLVDSRRVRIPR